MKQRMLAMALLFCGCCVLFPSAAAAQGCKGAVSGAYSTYTSYAITSINSNGTDTLSVSQTIDGYANLGNLEYCPQMTTAIHTPAVYVFVNGSGGWQYGPGKVATAYVDYTGTAQANVPDNGSQFEVEDGAQATCSLAGTFWFTQVAAFWPEIKIANYNLLSQTLVEEGGVPLYYECAYTLMCPNGGPSYHGTCYNVPAQTTVVNTAPDFDACGRYLRMDNLYFPSLGKCIPDVDQNEEDYASGCT